MTTNAKSREEFRISLGDSRHDSVKIETKRIATVGSIKGLHVLMSLIDQGKHDADEVRCVDDHGTTLAKYVKNDDGTWSSRSWKV